ncbi:hypothetical protein LAUMK4_05526 [Mycobacterium persicum]|uniref:Uncharacterized protein n=1 Tax=Mycobacterium persicum TaxID=1487726 RepID=A0AB38ULG5_9MYCO|nr:hypothetical protein LAUMK15_00256 [Mycobacterium persicum]VAZ81320.1 hypothetical protein LAUMK42_00121 [Mycobacterium persicum]VBA31655.1 hypothetical protein LAUMK4_05526 [Mycobacterium persicum]
MRAVVRHQTTTTSAIWAQTAALFGDFLVGALSGSLGRLPTQATLLPRTDRGRYDQRR